MSRQEEVQELLAAQERDLPRLSAARGIPCLGCPMSATCADLELACLAFARWVSGTGDVAGADREPTRRMFQVVMTERR